jgi:hypothetical protein
VRIYSPGQEFTTVPACNLAGTEFGLGFSHFTHPRATGLWNPSVKHVFRDFDTHSWGIGLSAGAVWGSRADRWANWSANVPVSIALDPDRDVVLHANLGWIKPEGRAGGVTGGIGMEVVLGTSWTLLAEAYDDHRGTAIGQFGFRRAIGDATSLDLLLGQDGLGNGPWLTLGFNTTFSR